MNDGRRVALRAEQEKSGASVDLTAAERSDAVTRAEAVVRRYVRHRLWDVDLVDDIVQEAMLRLLQAIDRLESSAVVPYAVVIARNVITDHARSDARARDNLARLLPAPRDDSPEGALLEHEELLAMREAVTRLGERDREVLLAHEVAGEDTASMARSRDSTPGAEATQLARARAKLRVEYALAFNGQDPTDERCRPVLVSLSAGDQRRQERLDAGDHLITCPLCAVLGPAVVERRRGNMVLAPFVLLAALVRRAFRSHGALTAGGAAAAVAVAAAVAAAAIGSGDGGGEQASPPPASACRQLLEAAGLDRGDDGYRADGLGVLDVPADEGFWIGSPDGRVWVALRGAGESDVEVDAGDRVQFVGQPVAHEAGFAAEVGVDDGEGAGLLDRQACHLSVQAADLVIR